MTLFRFLSRPLSEGTGNEKQSGLGGTGCRQTGPSSGPIWNEAGLKVQEEKQRDRTGRPKDRPAFVAEDAQGRGPRQSRCASIKTHTIGNGAINPIRHDRRSHPGIYVYFALDPATHSTLPSFRARAGARHARARGRSRTTPQPHSHTASKTAHTGPKALPIPDLSAMGWQQTPLLSPRADFRFLSALGDRPGSTQPAGRARHGRGQGFGGTSPRMALDGIGAAHGVGGPSDKAS